MEDTHAAIESARGSQLLISPYHRRLNRLGCRATAVARRLPPRHCPALCEDTPVGRLFLDELTEGRGRDARRRPAGRAGRRETLVIFSFEARLSLRGIGRPRVERQIGTSLTIDSKLRCTVRARGHPLERTKHPPTGYRARHETLSS